VRFAFILAEKAFYPITVRCRVLEVSRSGFHAWVRRQPSQRDRDDAKLAVEVAAVHERSRRTYGSPRVTAELRARGVRVGRKRVARIMRKKGLEARRKRPFRRTTDSAHSNPVAPNLVGRMFSATAPDRVWATDVKAVWTDEGWLYLAAMIDLFSRRIVGWATSARNDTRLAIAALAVAARGRHPRPGLVHHSDRGSPYASEEYRAQLARLGSIASMSRKGDCWDNAVSESFFSTLAAELLDRMRFATQAQATAAIADYIDSFYNLHRRHSTLGYLSPIEFELRSVSAASAA
jgi:transposase InsO family protein